MKEIMYIKLNKEQKAIRGTRKETDRYYPDDNVIKIGDIIALEDDTKDIDFTGIVTRRNDILVLDAGHCWLELPDNDDLVNMELVRFLGIKI